MRESTWWEREKMWWKFQRHLQSLIEVWKVSLWTSPLLLDVWGGNWGKMCVAHPRHFPVRVLVSWSVLEGVLDRRRAWAEGKISINACVKKDDGTLRWEKQDGKSRNCAVDGVQRGVVGVQAGFWSVTVWVSLSGARQNGWQQLLRKYRNFSPTHSVCAQIIAKEQSFFPKKRILGSFV